MIGIGIADGIGDFGNALNGVAEEVFGFGEAALLEIVVERDSERSGEQAARIGGPQADVRRQVG